MKHSPMANMKQKPYGFYEAARPRREASAMLFLREPKARFIGRSPASFFMRVSALHFQTKEHCESSALLFGI